MEEVDLTLHGFVAGRVQGVFFRAETRRKAIELGLSGWVKNLSDGRVEVLISGPDAALSQMEAWLQEGPRLARVDQLQLEKVSQSPPVGFDIRN